MRLRTYLRLTLVTALGCVITTVAPPIQAQQQKIQLYIAAQAEDTVGQTLLYDIRERLAASSRYAVAATEREALFQLRINTLNPYNPGLAPVGTVYAAVLTGTQVTPPNATVYLSQWVGTCLAAAVDSCAANLVASVDATITPLIETLSNYYRNRTAK